MLPATVLLAFLLTLPRPGGPTTPAPGYISGRLVDSRGRPVEGTVAVHPGASAPGIPVATARDGTFKLGPLPPGGNYRSVLTAEVPALGRESTLAPPVLPGATTDVGNIVVSPGRRYTGRVLTDQGQPVPNARVRIGHGLVLNRQAVYSYGHAIDVYADADGKYALPPLPVGGVYLTYLADDRERWYRSTRVQPGEPVELDVRLNPGIAYRGRAVDEDGKPVAGAVVDPSGLPVTTDQEGRFVLGGYSSRLPPGELVIEKAGFVPTRFTLGNGEVEVQLVRAGWFTGRVVDADTGLAVRLDSARLDRAADPKTPARTTFAVWSDALGQPLPGLFRVRFPEPGEYTVRLKADGYERTDFTAKAPERKTIAVPDVRMKRLAGPRCVGTATLDGKPVKSGWAVLYRAADPGFAADLVRGRPVSSRSRAYAEAEVVDGAFALTVPEDKLADWCVAVYAPGRPPGIVGPLALPRERPSEVAVEIPVPGSLSGVVEDVPTRLDGYLWVVAFARNGYRAEAHVRPGGKFAFPALPPGEYGLKVGLDLFKDAEVDAEVTGEVLTLENQRAADPWKRAVKVTVLPGQAAVAEGLTLPKE